LCLNLTKETFHKDDQLNQVGFLGQERPRFSHPPKQDEQDPIHFLESLVNIDSQTKNTTGVNLVQQHLQKYLSKLGFETQLIPNETSVSGHLLFAQKIGLSSETITFIGHADTVFSPHPDFLFNIDLLKNEVTGPGIGDDKGSLVMALSAIENFLDINDNHYYTLLFVCSPNEEMGSIGFHDIFKNIGERSKIVFGLEPALANGSLISSRNGNRWYNIDIMGRAAHSGRFNEPFVNAAHHASEFISKIHSLNDILEKVKLNVGSINSGSDRYNVICDSINLKLDTRFPTYEARDFLHNSIEKNLNSSDVECFYTQEKCTVVYEIVDDCPPLPYTDSSHSLLVHYLQEISTIEGHCCADEHSGGAADINYFFRPGLIYIDGLGPITSGMHTKKEIMKLESFYTRRSALENILKALDQNPEGL
jgi:glutamate carboxypeptidase